MNFGKKSKFWDTTKGAMQALIGKSEEDLTDEELVDAILESAKSSSDDADDDADGDKGGDKGDKKEPKTKAEDKTDDKADDKTDADTKSDYQKIMEAISELSGVVQQQGKAINKIQATRANAPTGGERDVEDKKGKTRFDSKKDAPVFLED